VSFILPVRILDPITPNHIKTSSSGTSSTRASQKSSTGCLRISQDDESRDLARDHGRKTLNSQVIMKLNEHDQEKAHIAKTSL